MLDKDLMIRELLRRQFREKLMSAKAVILLINCIDGHPSKEIADHAREAARGYIAQLRIHARTQGMGEDELSETTLDFYEMFEEILGFPIDPVEETLGIPFEDILIDVNDN